VEVDAVSCMTRRVDHLRPKLVCGPVFIKHDSYHINESTVLHFGNPIFVEEYKGAKTHA
jgi:hypothetical protein